MCVFVYMHMYVYVCVCAAIVHNVSMPSPPSPVESHCGGPVVCPPGHAEWGVCLLLEQVVCLTGTGQTAVCDESCRVGGPGRGGVRAGGERGV